VEGELSMDSDEHEHPLLTKRMGGALAVLALCSGVGVALMSFHLFLFGMILSLIGAVGAISIYWNKFKKIPLEVGIVIVALTIAVSAPVTIYYAAIELKPAATARLRLHYTQNPITSEVTQRTNVATFYTFAFLQDGTPVSGSSSSIKWSDLVIVFDRPTTATHLLVRFDSGATLIYHPAIIGPRLAIINFEGSLAEKTLDIELTTP
jgi:hypothetical protein